MSDIVNEFLRGVQTTRLWVDITPLFDDGDLKVTYNGIDILVHVIADIAPCADLENQNKELDTVILVSDFLSNPKEGKEYFKISPIGTYIDRYIDKIEKKIDFMCGAYTSKEGMELTSSISNSTLRIKYLDSVDVEVKVSIDFESNDNTMILSYSGLEDYRCSFLDRDLTGYVMSVVDSADQFDFPYFDELSDESEVSIFDDLDFFYHDKVIDRSENNNTDVSYISKDIIGLKVVKLMYHGELKGYRFDLRRGCLDISVERGTSLGLSQDKVVSEVELEERGGILVSAFEVANGFLVQNISDNIEICNKLLKALLSPFEDW